MFSTGLAILIDTDDIKACMATWLFLKFMCIVCSGDDKFQKSPLPLISRAEKGKFDCFIDHTHHAISDIQGVSKKPQPF